MTKVSLNSLFDKWFDEKFPNDHFGSLGGAFRLAMKTDIARAAFDFGRQIERERCKLLSEAEEHFDEEPTDHV